MKEGNLNVHSVDLFISVTCVARYQDVSRKRLFVPGRFVQSVPNS